MVIKENPSNSEQEYIEISGARLHNLKDITVKIPKGKIVAITGVSGSGKSTLAFDLLFEEGRTRYFQAIGMPPRVENEKQYDVITGLSPTIAVEQRTTRFINPRSTVGTRTGIYNYLRMLFALEAQRLCPICKEPVKADMSCPLCGMAVEPLQMKHFSFNEPSGMCLMCHGRGFIRDFLLEKIIPDQNKTLTQICAAASATFADMKSWMPSLAECYKFDLNLPYNKLPERIQKIFLYGTGSKKIEFTMETKQYVHSSEKIYEGVIPHLQRAMDKSLSELRRKKIEDNFMKAVMCADCHGFRLNSQACEAKIGDKHIGELALLTIDELMEFFGQFKQGGHKWRSENGAAIVLKVLEGLRKFEKIGLSYLHLNRSTRTLSGGENQRLSLMAQMTLGLNGVILILDEPTQGMHELEKANLASILKDLRDAGNSVIIVEHDEQFIRMADQIIDIGPGAGVQGGTIVAQGSLSQICQNPQSLTGQYLNRTLRYPSKTSSQRIVADPKAGLKITNVSTHTLKNITAAIPLKCIVGIAGVSGSGKSSLISESLVPLMQALLKARRVDQRASKNVGTKKGGTKPKGKNGSETEPIGEENGKGTTPPGEDAETSQENGTEDEDAIIAELMPDTRGTLSGYEQISDCIIVDQSPIGRNRNSFPASYIGLWDYIRKLFAQQPLAKERKYTDGHFSFNSDRGRCPQCKGEGHIRMQVSFLDEVSLLCEECGGQRYLKEILAITYHDKTIRDILDLSVEEAVKVFASEDRIIRYLKILQEIGMGYIKLGQPATTLSGGEAQRIKLARALGDGDLHNTLFILDEPTTGLHFHDEVKLLDLLQRIVKGGNSVVVIEHNPKVLAYCDYLIELGPGGGPKGGEIITAGTPEELKKMKESKIGPYL